MSLVVAKFGGTSVASPERIQNVAKRLIQKKEEGNQVVAVVSAMGKTARSCQCGEHHPYQTRDGHAALNG